MPYFADPDCISVYILVHKGPMCHTDGQNVGSLVFSLHISEARNCHISRIVQHSICNMVLGWGSVGHVLGVRLICRFPVCEFTVDDEILTPPSSKMYFRIC